MCAPERVASGPNNGGEPIERNAGCLLSDPFAVGCHAARRVTSSCASVKTRSAWLVSQSDSMGVRPSSACWGLFSQSATVQSSLITLRSSRNSSLKARGSAPVVVELKGRVQQHVILRAQGE